MLRNSTRKFRERYQNNQPHPYTSTGILTLRLSRHAQNLSSPFRAPSSPSPDLPQRLRKLEHSTSTATRTLQVKTKHYVDNQAAREHSGTGGQHRRQLTAPVGIASHEEESNGSVTTLEWQQEDAESAVKRDPKQFLSSIPKNSLFFCCTCFQYVFEIEKQRHFPDCKDALLVTDKLAPAFRSTAWERLQRIVELAKYAQVKAWEVEELSREVKSNDFSKIYAVEYPQHCSFFTLEEIMMAFVYTYESLLKGAIFTPPSFFTCY